MSVHEIQDLLNAIVGMKVESVSVNESYYEDGFVNSIILVFGDTRVFVSSRSFNDGSSCLDVDVT